MFQIKRIGEIEFQNGNVKVVVDASYRKGLRHAEQFSHMHLVYGCSVYAEKRMAFVKEVTVSEKVTEAGINEGGSTCTEKEKKLRGLMKSVVVKVEQIRLSEGIIIGHYAANLIENNVEPDCSGGILIDIKPYFPCEDRVKQEDRKYKDATVMSNRTTNRKDDILSESKKCIDKMEKSNTLHIAELLRTEERIEIESCGWIRKEDGRTFLEVTKEQLNGISVNEVIRVYWWFHRFDKPLYRKVTECDPPYENAPKVGIFASRSPVRPNPIAMTLARVIKVGTAAGRVYVNDLDCFDRTPCISIVPYAPEQDYIKEVEVAEWVRHWPEYWVEEAVEETMPVIEGSQDCSDNGSKKFIKIARENLLSGLYRTNTSREVWP